MVSIASIQSRLKKLEKAVIKTGIPSEQEFGSAGAVLMSCQSRFIQQQPKTAYGSLKQIHKRRNILRYAATT